MRVDISSLQSSNSVEQARVDVTNQREEQRLFRDVVQRTRSEAVAVSSASVQQLGQADAGQGARGQGRGGRPS